MSNDTHGQQGMTGVAARQLPSARGWWRIAAGVVGALGALLALASLPMPWYMLRNGLTYTGVDLLRSDGFAYTEPYRAAHWGPGALPGATCLTGVASGLSLPIGLLIAVCVALALLALPTLWRAPSGWWGWVVALAWIIGGWLARCYLFPWATTLINIDPSGNEGLRFSPTIGSPCAAPGVSDVGQSILQVGLLALCGAGLVYGLLWLSSVRRIARVGSIVGLVAYLVFMTSALLSYARQPASHSPMTLVRPFATIAVVVLTLIPPAIALTTVFLSRTNGRNASSEDQSQVATACLLGAPTIAVWAVIASIVAWSYPNDALAFLGLSMLLLSALLLGAAGVRGQFRTRRNGMSEYSLRYWSEL